jgi:GNAT superfamily N-acetyltransferase
MRGAEVTVVIRVANPDDAPAIQQVERLAGERYRDSEFAYIADDEPLSTEALSAYASSGRAWVADEDGRVCGYLLVEEVDDAAHIEQVSVQTDHQGQGIGRTLIDRAEQWARETGRTALTLTTFTDIPWNRPLYEHLGFRVLSADEIGPELRMVRDRETAQGHDPARRVVMRRDVG